MITANTPKFKMAAIWVNFGVSRLRIYSRGVILSWELQIDRVKLFFFISKCLFLPLKTENQKTAKTLLNSTKKKHIEWIFLKIIRIMKLKKEDEYD